jgi:hypothetical protein
LHYRDGVEADAPAAGPGPSWPKVRLRGLADEVEEPGGRGRGRGGQGWAGPGLTPEAETGVAAGDCTSAEERGQEKRRRRPDFA